MSDLILTAAALVLVLLGVLALLATMSRVNEPRDEHEDAPPMSDVNALMKRWEEEA